MIKEKYLEQIKKKVIEFGQNKDLKVFVFGSSLNKDHFGDLDLGIMGNVEDKDIWRLKDDFKDSTLPYFVDIINFNKVSENFKNNIFNNKILWIKR
ncbi:nucleotidyltransferase domain-containing protein [Candidatus Parcubacteria bacterium]|nr:nucleotidyltransferase domain-containing protein [Patescibacteria group bacterium]MBU4481935.1 nucleotidyltransferase domain-containing protein [Patescibacteria group bacterium]MCG2687097.1 nucleotidyltransferase domain-containing protein [Candidatus Parcubacteria bacterium]